MRRRRKRRLSVSSSHENGLAVRTYADVATEMEKRFGVKLSKVRVQQICMSAEKKMAAAMNRIGREMLEGA